MLGAAILRSLVGVYLPDLTIMMLGAGHTIHAHPTMSEASKEAGLAVSKSAIHGM